MANYLASCRSNYFKVKDEAKYREFCKAYSLEVIDEKSDEDPSIKLFGFMVDGSIPSGKLSTAGEWVEFNFFQDLAAELAKGEVAVVMEVGSEKMRYLLGYAVAVNHRGRTVEISLNNIYPLAKKKFGVEPSLAEY